MGLWLNGRAFDSRSKGCRFDSCWPQFNTFLDCVLITIFLPFCSFKCRLTELCLIMNCPLVFIQLKAFVVIYVCCIRGRRIKIRLRYLKQLFARVFFSQLWTFFFRLVVGKCWKLKEEHSNSTSRRIPISLLNFHNTVFDQTFTVLIRCSEVWHVCFL